MHGDFRTTDYYKEAESLASLFRRPGTGQISDARDVHASRDGKRAVFAGAMVGRLEGLPPTRICEIDLLSGKTRILTFGPNVDHFPRFSPDDKEVAFLSDRLTADSFQLYFLDTVTGAARSTSHIEGSVEYLVWSPDGKSVLLGVAGIGADAAGAQGARAGVGERLEDSEWMPRVSPEDERTRWRTLWVYDCIDRSIRRVGPPQYNVWEASWCGNDSIAMIVSNGPNEGLWYSASLVVARLADAATQYQFSHSEQMGLPAGSPSGRHLAVVLAPCSDRWIVAGEVHLIDLISGEMCAVATPDVDISHLEWRSATRLLLAGQRKAESVIIVYDVVAESLEEVWSSRDISTGGRYFSVAGLNNSGDCVMVGEGFTRAPEIGAIRQGNYATVRSFDLGYQEAVKGALREVASVEWKSADDLTVQGWLLLPFGAPPYPVVMDLHGGPVWLWRSRWLCRGPVYSLMLLRRGFAIFLPNPRGSVGQGVQFIRAVLGDVGGADAQDCLAGLEHIVSAGIGDPKRIGITGVSYGGYLTAWLITQDRRFAAAVPVSAITNFVTEYLLSNIPDFVSLFVGGKYAEGSSKYLERSPIMHAQKTETPTLNVCGALDRRGLCRGSRLICLPRTSRLRPFMRGTRRMPVGAKAWFLQRRHFKLTVN
jgi:dipeptidyl aminopeptidase/acylaminoacyl peptidase